jgi:arsenate reductase-like glutaredoxin family protein
MRHIPQHARHDPAKWDPVGIEYLKTPPSRERLIELATAMKSPVAPCFAKRRSFSQSVVLRS